MKKKCFIQIGIGKQKNWNLIVSNISTQIYRKQLQDGHLFYCSHKL